MPVVHVVDDDESTRRSLSRLLGGAGYEVVLHATAEAFLDGAKAGLTGCVLLDLRLEEASGLEVQDRLAECGCWLPIVFLTGHGDVAASVRAMKRGAVDFLEKPAAADELFASLRSALELWAQRQRQLDSQAELDQLRSRVATLTARQRDVWLRVVDGQLNKQIAQDLGLVDRTVKLHRARVMVKLGARSTAELVRMAERLELTRHHA